MKNLTKYFYSLNPFENIHFKNEKNAGEQLMYTFVYLI